MKQSDSITALATALVLAQSRMTNAKKDSNNQFFKSKYADLTSVVDAVKEALNDHGLSYIQFPCTNDKDEVGVETMLLHESGEWVRGDPFYVPVNKADAQGFGSAITYCRRYSLQAACGIAAEDDDGNAAAAAKPIADRMAADKGLSGAGVNQAAFDALPPDVQTVVREHAMEIIALIEDGVIVDALAIYESYTKHEDKLALWSQLPSKVRSTLKKAAQPALATQA